MKTTDSEAVAVQPSSYRWVIVGMLMITYVGAYLTTFSQGILLPSISDSLNLSPSQQGWLGSAVVLGSLVLAIPLGWWLSNYNANILVNITLFLGALLVFGQGWAPTFAVLLIVRVLFGLTLVARESPRAILTQQWIPPKQIVVVNSAIMATMAIGVLASMVLTPVILKALDNDWRGTFQIFGFISLGMAVLWLALGRQRMTPEYRKQLRDQEQSPLRSILRYPTLWIAGLALIGASVSWFAIITFWPTYMLDKFDLSLQTSGAILGISPVFTVLGAMVGAYLVVRKDLKREIFILCGLLLTGSFWAMLATSSIPVLVVTSAINGLGWAFFPLILSLPFQLPGIKPRELAVAVMFLEAAGWAGGAIGPVLTGLVQEFSDSLGLSLFIASSFGFVTTIGGLLLPRRRPVTVALE
ncbi:MAG: MFS transporter [Dehalococcoidia bacterium]